MKLLDIKISKTYYFETIKSILKQHYIIRDNLQPLVSYEEFKMIITEFVVSIMENLLKKQNMKKRFAVII